MKYFMAKGEEYAWPLKEFKTRIAEGETEAFILEEEKRDIGGEMWCWLHGIFVERGHICGDCGKRCSDYKPRNGRSGCCRNLSNGFVRTGKWFKLTKEGLKAVEQLSF